MTWVLVFRLYSYIHSGEAVATSVERGFVSEKACKQAGDALLGLAPGKHEYAGKDAQYVCFLETK